MIIGMREETGMGRTGARWDIEELRNLERCWMPELAADLREAEQQLKRAIGTEHAFKDDLYTHFGFQWENVVGDAARLVGVGAEQAEDLCRAVEAVVQLYEENQISTEALINSEPS